MSVLAAEAEEYHSKDFEWETLKQQIENDPSLQYHLLPFHPSQGEEGPENDSDAWKRFHSRHSSGKFFKVPVSDTSPFFLLQFFSLFYLCFSFMNLVARGFLRRQISCRHKNLIVRIMMYVIFNSHQIEEFLMFTSQPSTHLYLTASDPILQ